MNPGGFQWDPMENDGILVDSNGFARRHSQHTHAHTYQSHPAPETVQRSPSTPSRRSRCCGSTEVPATVMRRSPSEVPRRSRDGHATVPRRSHAQPEVSYRFSKSKPCYGLLYGLLMAYLWLTYGLLYGLPYGLLFLELWLTYKVSHN